MARVAHRSRVHMLTVAAARLEEACSNPKLAADLREAAKAAAKKRAEGCDYSEEDQRRIERQRTLFVTVPDTHALGRLKDAMLQRAYDLMWDGDCLACDALAEFLPSADVDRMFEAWHNDQDPKGDKKSKFYEAAE